MAKILLFVLLRLKAASERKLSNFLPLRPVASFKMAPSLMQFSSALGQGVFIQIIFAVRFVRLHRCTPLALYASSVLLHNNLKLYSHLSSKVKTAVVGFSNVTLVLFCCWIIVLGVLCQWVGFLLTCYYNLVHRNFLKIQVSIRHYVCIELDFRIGVTLRLLLLLFPPQT